ncbi:MAG: hypothetical protein GX564_06020 [Oligosphaeraceae bacterium]|nr:hypothetical protein [Oligosphaeraceae bacterium]
MDDFIGCFSYEDRWSLRWEGPADCHAEKDGCQVLFAGVLRNRPELVELLRCPPDLPAAALFLELYLKYGEAAAAKLNGPFCFALLSRQPEKVLLGRDQLGQSFLFYGRDSQQNLLCSNRLPLLLQQPGLCRDLDLLALQDYLGLGYIPSPRTIYQSVAKVRPASLVLFTGPQTEGTSLTYWEPVYLPKRVLPWPEVGRECRRLLEQAGRRCLQGHAQANYLLSGGIDSGVVLGLTAPLQERAGEAISIAFDHPLYDESTLAGLTAARHRLPQRVRKVTPGDIEALAPLLAGSGEPFADSSLLPTRLALQAAAESAAAVFTGDGGDELFCGYRRLQFMAWRCCCWGLPAGIGQALAKCLQHGLPQPGEQRSRLANLTRMIRALAKEKTDCYACFQEIFSRDCRQQLLTRTQEDDYLQRWRAISSNYAAEDWVEKCDALDILTYLPDDGFRKSDIAGTGLGLDTLCPILDLEVAEFALTLPRRDKITLRERKRPLRHLARELLPAELLAQTKRGFGTPVAAWFRAELAPMIREMARTLPDWDQQGWLNRDYVQELVNAHLVQNRDCAPQLWTLLCLQLWCQSSRA